MKHFIRLIIGLGNPGQEYKDTRHNAGYWFVHALASKCDLVFRHEPKFKSSVTEISEKNSTCWLLQPETFMNKSGEAVNSFINFYKILPSSILVVHDELDFFPGVARLKYDGGHNGHNGIKSIISSINSNQFYRLRIGIGRPENKDQVVTYVLKQPSKNDRTQIMNAIEKGLKIIPELLQGDIESAIQKLHTV